MTDQRTAFGYVRVSTGDQAERGVSLDAQKAQIRAYCEAHGFKLSGIWEDVVSGKRADNRLGLQGALRQTCKNRGVLVVSKLDRLARSTTDAIAIANRIQECRADLAILDLRIDTTTPMGEFVFTLMAALGQMERRMIGERTRLALAHKRRQGERISRHAPYGWEFTASNRLSPIPDEQQTLETIRRMREYGTSFQQIAVRLNENGISPKRAERWSASGVRAVLKRMARAEA